MTLFPKLQKARSLFRSFSNYSLQQHTAAALATLNSKSSVPFEIIKAYLSYHTERDRIQRKEDQGLTCARKGHSWVKETLDVLPTLFRKRGKDCYTPALQSLHYCSYRKKAWTSSSKRFYDKHVGEEAGSGIWIKNLQHQEPVTTCFSRMASMRMLGIFYYLAYK